MSTSKGIKKKEYILDKAKELYIQKGYTATSMEDLVQYSGVSKGSIYYHFKSKEDLFFQLLKQNSVEWEAAWREIEAKCTSFSEKIYHITEHYISEFQNPITKVSQEFSINQPDQHEEMIQQLLEIVRAPLSIYCEIFAEGMQSGDIITESVEDIAIMFAGLLDGIGPVYYERSEEEVKEFYHKAVRYFLKGIKP